MRIGTRIGIGTLLAATLSLSAVAPAAAGGYYHGGGYGGGYGHGWGGYHHDRGIGIGGVLLGAALIGGIAAIASQPRAPAYDNGYTPYDGYRGGEPQGSYAEPGYDDRAAAGDPVEQCSRAAERAAQEDGRFARVTGIDRVENRDRGVRVRGTLQIDDGDHTRFDCTADYGRITALRLG